MSTRLATLTLALVVVSTPAWAVVIDFAGVPSAGNPIRSGTLTVDGFDFTSGHFQIIDTPVACLFGGCVTPEQYIAGEAGSLGQPITMTKSGGGTFTLNSFDFDQLFMDSTAAALGGFPNAVAPILWVTFLHSGPSGYSIGPGDGRPGFETIPTPFLPLVLSVQFSGDVRFAAFEGLGAFAIDNIRVDEPPLPEPEPQVPEPGTLLLLGAGMAALARRRRRWQ